MTQKITVSRTIHRSITALDSTVVTPYHHVVVMFATKKCGEPSAFLTCYHIICKPGVDATGKGPLISLYLHMLVFSTSEKYKWTWKKRTSFVIKTGLSISNFLLLPTKHVANPSPSYSGYWPTCRVEQLQWDILKGCLQDGRTSYAGRRDVCL